jgi:bifunctional non-homologous end joining protein LigD
MKKHHATRLHYDLRLEWNGILLSWALPEGPSCHAKVGHEAIEMEDHNKEYLLFEGMLKTGTIMLWDRGTWEPYPESKDIEKSLRKGLLRFMLHGEKLKGGWTLQRTITTDNAMHPLWTLSKHTDAFAESYVHRYILKEMPDSISTGRSLKEIERDWIRPKDKHQQQMKLFDAA